MKTTALVVMSVVLNSPVAAQWLDARVFDINLPDGALFLGATRLMPQSERP